MANGWPSPLVLPEPASLVVGERLGAPAPLRIGEASNYLHASLTRVYPGQHWPDGGCAWNSTPAVAVAEWAVPLPSPAHQALRCEVWASASANAGKVIFTSATTGDVLTLDIDAGAKRYAGTLDVGAPGAGYDTVTMSLEATSGDVQVDSRMFWPVALTSPLAAGTISTVGGGRITPFGQGALAANQPLPGGRGRMMIETAQALILRPRCLWCWSGLQGIGAHKPNARTTMPAYPHRQLCLVNPGSEARGRQITFRVKTAANASGVDQYVYAELGALEGQPVLIATQPDEAAAAWHDAKVVLPEAYQVGGLPYLASWITVHPGPGRTTAGVLSLSAWGE